MPSPDWEGAKAYYWMKQVRAAEAAGTVLPRRPKPSRAQADFNKQVNTRMSRRCYTVDIRIVDGKVIRE